MTSLTFFTASRTPLPPNRLWSPSRSSTASCSPVDAPLGTAARPAAPLERVTSASMVGLPRLSGISRARTEMIVLMMARTLAVVALGVNARLQGENRGMHPVAQLLAPLDRHPRRGDRLADHEPDPPRSQEEPTLGHDLERVADLHPHHRPPGRDGQPEGGVLERQQLSRAAPRPLEIGRAS